MRTKFNTIEDVKKAIKNNSEVLKNKSAFSLEIELETKLSDKDMTRIYNELYADDNVRLVLIKSNEGFYPKAKFEVELLGKKFYIVPEFIENSVGLVYLLEMQYHFEALKRLIDIASSLDNTTKVEFRSGKPILRAFEDEKDRLWSEGTRYNIHTKEGLEMYYLNDIVVTIVEELMSKKEFINYLNADFA